MKACVEEYVEGAVTILQRNIGVGDNRRVFDIKCLMATKLHLHLMSIHKYTNSELSVMYLSAKKDKHGVPKSFHCQLCCNWHMRLDNYLKRVYKLVKNEVQSMLKADREKHWSTSVSADMKKNVVDL